MTALWSALVGLGAGVASGAFGIGGALLTTPAIRVLLDVPALVAVGTPLPVIIPTAVAGLWAYVRGGFVDTRLAAITGVTGVASSVVGAWLTDVIGGEILLIATSVVIGFLAYRMLPRSGEPPHIEGPPSTYAALGIGVLSGFSSGLLGVGGGFVLVPLFTVVLRLPLKRALGTSLAVVAVQAVPGTIVHAMLGHVDWAIAAGLAAGVIPGGVIGSRLAVAARDKTLRVVVSVALFALALAFGISEIVALAR